MRTSLNEIQEAERFLTHNMMAEDALLFQAKMIVHPELRSNVNLQSRLTDLVQLYHRRKLKRELKAIHHELAKKSDFQQLIRTIFHL